jgi:glycosyltransferase involved in cell wall biosynthesis
MDNIRLLMVAEGLHSHFGGQAVSIANLVSAISKTDCDIKLLAGIRNRSDKVDGNSFPKCECSYFQYVTKFKFSPSLVYELFRLRNDFEILHCNGIWNFISLVCALFCLIFKKKLVLSPRGMAAIESINRSKLRQVYFALVQLPVMNWCSFLHVTSAQEQRDLLEKGVRAEIILAPNGVRNFPVVRFNDVQNLRQKVKQICFVGRICRYKNVDLLIKAFAELDDEFSDWKLCLAGPIEDQAFFDKIVSSTSFMENKEKILFLGPLNHDELIKLYSESSFLVCCSNSENFGLGIAEGLHFGLPAICPKKSPWSSMGKDYLYSIDPKTQAVIKGLKYFMEDYTFSASNFDMCRQKSSEYTWARQSSVLLDKYRRLLDYNQNL